MNYTQNYQLPQWVETDRILMDDFNDAFSALDTALDGHETALDTLQTQVAENAASADTAIAAKGNCSIQTLSYKGDGQVGEENKRTLTFSAKPIIVLVYEKSGSKYLLLLRGRTKGINPSVTTGVTASWGSSTVSWWSNSNNASLNENGGDFLVFAMLSHT